jgi:hypothetical protein
MNLKPFRNLLILPLIIVILGLACQLSGGPTPSRNVPVSAKQASDLEQLWQKATPDPQTGKITVTMTEAQVSSYVVYNLKDRLEPVLKSPVVLFEKDQIELYGTIHSDSIDANGRIVFSLTIDAQGQPSVQIKEANFGPIPVPTGLLGDISTAINKSLVEATAKSTVNYQLESVSLSSGSAKLTIIPKR